MKLAIHHSSWSFSSNWIEYCRKSNIEYKLVDCFNSNIIEDLKDCDALLWHYSHAIYKDVLVAKKILFSMEQAGKLVFPNFNTCWHFDDKVSQKYLFEAKNIPHVPSYVFYDKNEALVWIKCTDFPKVFKLKGGAGGANVKLVKSKKQAMKIVKRAFYKGFSQFNRFRYLSDRYKKFKNGQDSFLGIIKGVARLFIPTEYAKLQSREKGYVYFQDFIPNNNYDIRIVVIGDKAIGEKRFVRKDDFRASGSGLFSYDNIDIKIVKSAFEAAKSLGLQSVAFDYIMDNLNIPLIIEMSYGFGVKGISKAPGYWDSNLQWHQELVSPQEWIIEDLIEDIECKCNKKYNNKRV